MQTISEFCAKHGVFMDEPESVDSNPNMDSDQPMDHWRCTLHIGELGVSYRDHPVYFSMGLGHNGKPPKIEDVLDCLASDAAIFENARNFEDWASELGYSEDSRKAEAIYKTCEQEAFALSDFLGEDVYRELLWETERE